MSEPGAWILAALQKAADGCLMRVREPDAAHQGEWSCTWLDAIDVVRSVAGEQAKHDYDAGWKDGYAVHLRSLQRAHNYAVERRFGRWSVSCSTCGERERIRKGTWLPPWGCSGAPTMQQKASEVTERSPD